MLFTAGDVEGFANLTGVFPSLPVPAGSTERASPTQSLLSDSGTPEAVSGLTSGDSYHPYWLRHILGKSDSETSLVLLKLKVLVTKSSHALCGPIDCSPPGSSVHVILQVRILECVAIPFSRASS